MEHILLVLFICKIINVYPLWPRCMWLVLYSWLCFRCVCVWGGGGGGGVVLCVCSPLLQFLCLCWFPVSCSSQFCKILQLGEEDHAGLAYTFHSKSSSDQPTERHFKHHDMSIGRNVSRDSSVGTATR